MGSYDDTDNKKGPNTKDKPKSEGKANTSDIIPTREVPVFNNPALKKKQDNMPKTWT